MSQVAATPMTASAEVPTLLGVEDWLTGCYSHLCQWCPFSPFRRGGNPASFQVCWKSEESQVAVQFCFSYSVLGYQQEGRD